MQIKSIVTPILHPPHDDLFEVIRAAVTTMPERSVLVVTSKVVSIWEGRCVAVDAVTDKDTLAIQESDTYVPRGETPHGWCLHTMKHNLFVPSAGIDRSNAANYYILWPKDPTASAERIWRWCRDTYGVTELGVLITDSHSVPLRRGVVGISLGHYGFEPLRDYRNTPDLFGRELKVTQTNIADGLAAAAVLIMGEGAESTPLVQMTDVPHIQFVSTPLVSTKRYSSFEVPPTEDMYAPFFASLPWKQGGGGVSTTEVGQ